MAAMPRRCDSPPAFDLDAAQCITAPAAAAPGVDAALAHDCPPSDSDAPLRLLLVQRVDCLSARVQHLEKQLRQANATAWSLRHAHALKDHRIAELEARLERRRAAVQQLKASVSERDSQLAARVREIATLQAMARKLR